MVFHDQSGLNFFHTQNSYPTINTNSAEQKSATAPEEEFISVEALNLLNEIQNTIANIPSGIYISPAVQPQEIYDAKTIIKNVEKHLARLIVYDLNKWGSDLASSYDRNEWVPDLEPFDANSIQAVFETLKMLELKLGQFNQNNCLISEGMHIDAFTAKLFNIDISHLFKKNPNDIFDGLLDGPLKEKLATLDTKQIEILRKSIEALHQYQVLAQTVFEETGYLIAIIKHAKEICGIKNTIHNFYEERPIGYDPATRLRQRTGL